VELVLILLRLKDIQKTEYRIQEKYYFDRIYRIDRICFRGQGIGKREKIIFKTAIRDRHRESP